MKRTISAHPVCSQLHGRAFWRLDLYDHRTNALHPGSWQPGFAPGWTPDNQGNAHFTRP